MNLKIVCWLLISVLITTDAQIDDEHKQFSDKVLKILSRENGNLVSSPLIIDVIFSLVYQGTGGKTYNAFTKVLGEKSASTVAEEYYDTLSNLSSFKNVEMKIFNKFIVMEGLSLNLKFKDTVRKQFRSEIKAMDFSDNVKSIKKINSWVRKKTMKTINELVTTKDLDFDTNIVLLNAVYFKGNWNMPFFSGFSTKEIFYLLTGKDTKVDMMNHYTEYFMYVENNNLNAQIVELPYAGDEVSMYIMLPKDVYGIYELENRHSEIDYSQLSSNMYSTIVHISLPKFKIESKIPMEDIFIKMGLSVIFSDKANFSQITDKPVKIGRIIQKVFIEVNEKGSDDGGATIKSMPVAAQLNSRKPVFFRANHPFLFSIVDKISQNILFMGRVLDPTEKLS